MRISDNPLRGQQFPAALLLAAAALGLLLANVPTHDAIAEILHAHIAIPGTGLDLTVHDWVADGLLAIFFLVVAIELRHELTHGELDSLHKAVQPAIAAGGGVVVPIGVYLLIAGPAAGAGTTVGWPIPTATDIAFALGVLAMFGKGLPSDIIGIIFIAVLFAHDVNWVMFALAVACVAVFAVLSRVVAKNGSSGIAVLMGVIAVVAWGFMALSGIHATIAGVMLGLAMSPVPAEKTRHALEPTVNGAILPIFAFVAAFVVIPQVSPSELSPAFWGILIALPVGKIIGIGIFGWLSMQLRPKGTEPALRLPDILAAGTLGGIGFTVSLLLANLAFAGDDAVRDQAILGVLGGSLIALLLSAVIVSARARAYRTLAAATE
jgi:NhaA family Na+:H+ antiporter